MATSAFPSSDSASKPAGVRKAGIFRSPNVHRWLRTFHRAAGLIFGVFIAVLGITGILVEIEMLMGPGAHGGRGVFGSTVHFLIMDIHTFFIFGLGAGLVVELLVTTALILFCVSGLWFYAALFRQWLKLAIKESGFVPSRALRAANRFMAWIAVALVAICAASAVVGTLDWAITRPALMAAMKAHTTPPPRTFGVALDAYYAAGGPTIVMTISIVALIYFIVVGLWYSGRVFVAWRRTRAAHPGRPAQPAKAMRTIHRWLSVPFGIYLVIIAFTGIEQIPTLWTAGHLPFLYSSEHLNNLKRDAIIAKNKTLPPDQQIPLPRERRGPAPTANGEAGPGFQATDRNGNPIGGGPAPTANAEGGPGVAPGADGGRRGGEQFGVGAPGNGGQLAGTAPGNGGPGVRGGRGGRFGGARRPRNPNPLYGVLSQYFVEVHSGAVFGPAGRIFVIFAGLALVFFSISGIWMYVTMYFPRRESGRKALIWH